MTNYPLHRDCQHSAIHQYIIISKLIAFTDHILYIINIVIQIITLKALGGTDFTAIGNTILSKLMTNCLAIRYSFAGKSKKIFFKETFPTVLKKIISEYIYVFFMQKPIVSVHNHQ